MNAFLEHFLGHSGARPILAMREDMARFRRSRAQLSVYLLALFRTLAVTPTAFCAWKIFHHPMTQTDEFWFAMTAVSLAPFYVICRMFTPAAVAMSIMGVLSPFFFLASGAALAGLFKFAVDVSGILAQTHQAIKSMV